MTEYEAFVQSPHLQVVSFVGKRSSEAKGFFMYDPETSNGLFYGTRFPSLPPRTVYQIWALIRKPVSLGTFKPDARKTGRLWIPNAMNLVPGTKFAVSVEAGTGASKPTGDILLLGEMPKNK